MSEFATPPGLETGMKASLTIGWAASQTHLQFVDVGDGAKVDHKLASGRIANSCRAVEPFFEAAKASGKGSIMNTPITLPTPGKADVVVTILADPDGYEICFVGDVGFWDLATPLYDRVDWGLRSKRGGDGGAAAAGEKKHTENLKHHATPVELEVVTALASSHKYVVLDFGAGWCKKCHALEPTCEEMAASYAGKGVQFVAVDVDEGVDICEEYQVSNVPHFVVLKGGSKVAEYKGDSKEALQQLVEANCV